MADYSEIYRTNDYHSECRTAIQFAFGYFDEPRQLGQFGWWRQLLKPENVTPFQQFLAIMDSRDVAEEMERRGHYMERLFPERWDAVKNTWKPQPHNIFTLLKGGIKEILRLPNYSHPVIADLARIIHDRVGIDEDEKESIYTLNFAAKDPVLAKGFLSALYSSIETVLLRRERVTAIARVDATLRQIDQTTVDSNRQALLNVLTAFQMRAIQAEVGSPFGARILLEPTAPNQPNDPSIILFMGGGFLGGLVLSLFLVLIFGINVARDFIPHSDQSSARHRDNR